MTEEVISVRTMEKYQGDVVLVEVADTKEEFMLTVVHVVDVAKHSLLLVNKKDRTKDSWEVTPAILDNLVKFHDPKQPLIKWKLNV